MRIDDGYIIYKLDDGLRTYFIGKAARKSGNSLTEWNRPTGKTYSDSQKWSQNHNEATVFDEINEQLVQTVRFLRKDADTTQINVASKVVEINELDFNEGELYKYRVDHALKKLDTDEIKLLGLGKIAMEYKLRSED